jgi:hypothetical protein
VKNKHPHVVEGFTDAEIDEILRAPCEPGSVAHSTNGYTPVGRGRDVIILGRAGVVVPGKKVLAVDEEGFWHRNCLVQRITEDGVVDGVELVRAVGRIRA